MAVAGACLLACAPLHAQVAPAQAPDAYGQAVSDARSLRLQGDTTQAALAYERAYNAAANDQARAAVLNDLAAMYQAANDTKRAIAAYERLLKLPPKAADPVRVYRQIVALQERTGDIDGAVATCQAGIKAVPQGQRAPSDFYFTLSRLYRRLGDSAKAADCLKRYIDLLPAGIVDSQAGIMLTQYLLDAGDYAGAEASARKAAAAAPEGTDILMRLAIGLRDKGQFERAIGVCRDVLKAKPTDPGVLTVLFDTCKDQGTVDKLLAEARKAAAGGDLPALRRLALFASRAGDAEEALQAQERILATDPNDVATLRTAADTALQAAKFDRAAEFYRRLVKLQPDDQFVGIALGDALAKGGHSDEAMATWKAATHYKAADARSVYQYGRILTEHSLYREAISIYTEARATTNLDTMFAGALAEAYEGALQFDKATEEYLVAMSAPNEGPYASGRLTALARDEVAAKDVCRVLLRHAAEGKLPDLAAPALARAQLAGGAKASEALKAFDSIANAQTRGFLLLQLAQELEQDGSPAAVDALERVLTEKIDPMQEAAVAQRVARAHVLAGNTRAAIDVLRAHRKPGLPSAIADRGDLMLADLLLHEVHRVEEARTIYAEVIQRRGGDASIQAAWGLADCAFAAGDYPAATDAYTKLAHLPAAGEGEMPPPPPGQLNLAPGPLMAGDMTLLPGSMPLPVSGRCGPAYVAYQLAEMSFRDGKLEESKAAFRKLAGEFADSEWAARALERVVLITGLGSTKADADSGIDKWLLALKLRDRGDLGRALALVTAVPAESPVSDEAWLLKAQILSENGELTAAVTNYTSLAHDRPESSLAPRALLEAAQALRQSGARAQAGKLLEQLVAQYPDSPIAATGRAALEEWRRAQ